MKIDNNLKEKHHVITHPNVLPTTFAQDAADKLSRGIGSWAFIIIFIILLIAWILMIVYALGENIELDHFLLLNLFLSCIAAIQAPIILMAQNRANQKDRLRAEYAYSVNRKSEKEIEQIQKQLDRIERKLK
jgi:uncharacterized membrane protein